MSAGNPWLATRVCRTLALSDTVALTFKTERYIMFGSKNKLFTVYLPIPDGQSELVKSVRDEIGRISSGFTQVHGYGGWYDPKRGKIVYDEVFAIQVLCSASKARFLESCVETWRKWLDQDELIYSVQDAKVGQARKVG